MMDMERITDQLRVDMADIGYKAKGKSSDYWDGYRKGKTKARIEAAFLFFIVAMVAGYFI